MVEHLREAADMQKQLELAQEQLTMKPSVAKKLNDRIRALETELSITRKRSTIAELEKKVARLEVELRQSYSTKNFTLKSGLLDIEKRHREFIYDNPDIEDLWTEVLGLLVEDKESLPAGTVLQKARVNQKIWRSPSAGVVASAGLPNGLPSAAAGAPDVSPPLDNRSLNKVQDEIEKLEVLCLLQVKGVVTDIVSQ
ncbi:hypothetical protein DUNSADRAFT_6162 [Dunaliella salina]|uniref:Uncharacterized protein n=1 Tax=Dunaliella salina TaxID=3046 RepID=A0ABQ7GNV3_DUNSA|nr:hypothetical protein DUNSADRAFT_6162 [Dunaliella salina]|eukprot:KAF5836285.1 hypothetical protein DUNSADRAFT_6162 [Dunaliella salina]